MSHGEHDPMDHRALPTTTGVAFGVKVLIYGGVLLAAMQGFFVVGQASFGRVWPASDSVKVELPPYTP